jgi:hypothetical protein
MNAFAAAEQSGKAADLQRELEALFERENRSEAQRHRVDSCHLPARHSRPVSGLTFRDERKIAP